MCSGAFTSRKQTLPETHWRKKSDAVRSIHNPRKLEFIMANKPGDKAEQAGIYWCSVCKTPVQFKAGDTLPTCKNKCGRGHWEFVRAAE